VLITGVAARYARNYICSGRGKALQQSNNRISRSSPVLESNRTAREATLMDPDKDNANPTILNPSDLPSRRQGDIVQPRKDGGTGLFDGLIPPYSYLSDPYETSSSSSDTDESNIVEEIDEQEVYGS